jgi:lipopolysaccharide export system permease protein
MNSVKRYLYKVFTQTFFPIFSTLFLITSVIFLVKIASLTSVIQLTFYELIELYIYNVPTILFYSVPVTMFVSLVLAFSKISSEYELIVMTSFGLSPIKILKILFPLLLFSTFVITLIALLLVPKAQLLKEQFLYNKKKEANFNIKASEYGQEFGNWMIYVSEENNGIYSDLVLYKKEKSSEMIIISERGDIKNVTNAFNLNLQSGKLFDIKNNELSQIDFKKMVLHNQINQKEGIKSLNDFIEYWKNDTDKFAFSLLGSLFPLISIFFIIFAGYYNPRYEKNRSVLLSLVITVVFIVISQKLSKVYELQTLLYLPLMWFLLGYYLYRYKIKPAY